jgi:hypothetical protein
MHGKDVYIRPKVVRPFPEPCASRSYVHQAAPLIEVYITMVKHPSKTIKEKN